MKTSDPIIVKQTLNAPVKEVWEALTVLDKMRQWYFDNIPDFKAEAGFKTQFEVQSDTRSFQHKWEVLDVQPEKSIKYSWQFEGIEGLGYVTFAIQPQAEGTLLTLTNTGLESFPDNIPEFTPESCRAGWEYFIQGNLKEYFTKH